MAQRIGRGTKRAEDAEGTPTQSHISPSIHPESYITRYTTRVINHRVYNAHQDNSEEEVTWACARTGASPKSEERHVTTPPCFIVLLTLPSRDSGLVVCESVYQRRFSKGRSWHTCNGRRASCSAITPQRTTDLPFRIWQRKLIHECFTITS